MLSAYRSPIAIAKSCVAIANIGPRWEDCWAALLEGKRPFSTGAALIPGWPASPPLSAILDFPGHDGQPAFAQRTQTLARIVGQQIKGSVDRLAGLGDLRLSLIVATSHGDPGPLSDLVDQQGFEPAQRSIQPGSLEGVLVDHLVEQTNAGLGRALPGITISAACASSLVAISYAADRINAGLCDAVLVVAVDTLSRVATVGFNNIGAMSQVGCRPYDRQRDGTTVGEGAVAMLLVRDGLLQDAEVAGFIGGTGVFCDAAHMVEPNPQGIVNVVRDALHQAGLAPADVKGIFWHGTGTRQNDQAEALASSMVFGERSPPCTSTKGCLGHTMGASGGFNVLAACATNQSRRMPHTAATLESEYPNLDVVTGVPREIEPGPMLVTALGFGGINAAVLVLPGRES